MEKHPLVFQGLEEKTPPTCSEGCHLRSAGHRIGTSLTVLGVVDSSHYGSALECEELKMELAYEKLTTVRIWTILKTSFPVKKIKSLSPRRE